MYQMFCFLQFFMLFIVFCYYFFVFFFKQKTAYEMRISDWSSDVCSSDLTVSFEILNVRKSRGRSIDDQPSCSDDAQRRRVDRGRRTRSPPSRKSLSVRRRARR